MCYYFINMNIKQIYTRIKQLTQPQENEKFANTLAEYNREALVKAGRQQFQKLKDLGLNIPVNLA